MSAYVKCREPHCERERGHESRGEPHSNAAGVVWRANHPRALEIKLSQRGGNACCACSAPTDHTRGLPMRDGKVIAKDDTGEWGGFDACDLCVDAYEIGGLATLAVRVLALRERAIEIIELRQKLERIRGEFDE